MTYSFAGTASVGERAAFPMWPHNAEIRYNAPVSLDPTRVAAYAALVQARKACAVCTALMNPAACDGGVYDSDQIGPWSLWQGNLNAKLVVVGQDWGDTRYFFANRGREAARNPTNETLRKLLDSIGIEVAAPGAGTTGGARCFFTNAVLCLKQGGLQAKVDPEWFTSCGNRFLRPTIDLIAPKAVVSLGEWAYRAILAAYGVPRIAFKEAVERPDGFKLAGRSYFPMYHCGARILNTHRRYQQQQKDWQRVKEVLS